MATATEPMTTEDFFRLIEAGRFDPHRRIDLWRGRLREATAKTPEHAHLANLFNKAMAPRVPEGWFVSAGNPLALNSDDAPSPDFTIVAGHPLDYYKARRHVAPSDIAVVVEIPVSSRPRDMGERRSKYAHAMAPTGGTYVVVDAKNRKFWVHEEPAIDPANPAAGVWNRITEVGPGDSIRLSLRGQALAPIRWDELMC